MNELQIFNNPEFGQVRVGVIEGKPMFCLADLCRILDLTQPSKVKERLNEKGVNTIPTLTNGGTQKLLYVDEPNLYKVIFQSRKPEAERFTDWVTSEVLPTIRKTGGYVSNEDMFINTYLPYADEKIKVMFRATLAVVRQQNEQLKEMKPKAEFFDTVAGSKDAIAIGDAAKVLNMGIGRNKLFQLLREKKVLMKDNIPYQEYIDRGYFRTIEQKWTTPEGETKISIKTLVYQKGLDFIRKLLNREEVVS